MFDLVNIEVIVSIVKCSLHFFIYIFIVLCFFCIVVMTKAEFCAILVLVSPGFF